MAHTYTNPYGDQMTIRRATVDGPMIHVLNITMSNGDDVKYIISRADLLHMLDEDIFD